MSDTPVVPIFDPNRNFRVWALSEVYTGPNGTGRYVPNTNDAVWDWASGLYRVAGVDLSTGLSNLELYVPPKEEQGLDLEDILLGVKVNGVNESYRAYINDTVTPHTLALDSRLHYHGSAVTSVKVFKGTDISERGQVISAMYDSGGTFLGENIPVELVAMPDQNNIAIKTPMVGYTLANLQDGEVLTVVAYNDAAVAVSLTKVLVKNTGFIRSTDASKKYVTGIHLESPLLSSEDNKLLQFPVNMPMSAVLATGVVTYSDGSEVRMPANGGRFKLYGLDHHVTTTIGQRIPLVLSYQLNEDEVCYGATPTNNAHLTESYWAVTTEYEKAFKVKLYAFPRWVDGIQGYTLDFFLYNLERSTVYYVNSLVEPVSGTQQFIPMQYGTKQHLSFAIDMSRVSDYYPTYRHVETLDITLLSHGSNESTNWSINFDPDQDPSYGPGLVATMHFVDTDNWILNVKSGFNSKEEWLNNVFYRAKPLHNYVSEVTAPPPNYFVVKTKLRKYEFPIDMWDQNLAVINDLIPGENVYIEFIHRIQENDLQLGVGAMPVIHV